MSWHNRQLAAVAGTVAQYERPALDQTAYEEERTLGEGHLSTTSQEKHLLAHDYEEIYTGGQSESRPDKNTEAICKKKRTVNLTTWPPFAPMSVAVLKQCVYLLAGATFLWIPGIVAMSAYHALAYSMYAHPTLMGVGLFWWSAWLSFCWASFWLAAAIAYVSPSLVRLALGAVSLTAVRLTIYLEVCRRYTTAVVWTLMAWSAYLSFVWTHFPGRETVDNSLLDPLSANSTVNATSSSTSTQSIIDALYGQGTATGTGTTSNAVAFLLNNNSNSASLISISRLLFGLVICSSLLLSEKLAIQAIANSFHAVMYSDRIALVKYHAGVLTKLYEQAKRQGIPSRVLRAEINAECLPLTSRKRDSWQSIRNVLSNFALPFKTVYGNGESIPFMPPAATEEQIVEATLENRKETMKLAHTIWSALSVEDAITIKQVMPAFSNEIQAARRAFNVLDRDRNGSLRSNELLYACLEIHNERITLLHSMSDIDFAVGKLDRILTTLWGTISLVILAALLSSRISTLLSSLGAILLGLSWLIASSAQEILASLLWVFAKHAIDVGDVITVPGLVSTASASATKDPIATLEGFNDGDTFVVEEVQLLSTILRLQSSGKQVQVSNALLSQRPLINLGRSGQLEEPFIFPVAFDTPFENLQALQHDFSDWLKEHGRDFRPGVQLSINGLEGHTQMTIVIMIRYKSNWQNSELRLRRR